MALIRLDAAEPRPSLRLPVHRIARLGGWRGHSKYYPPVRQNDGAGEPLVAQPMPDWIAASAFL